MNLPKVYEGPSLSGFYHQPLYGQPTGIARFLQVLCDSCYDRELCSLYDRSFWQYVCVMVSIKSSNSVRGYTFTWLSRNDHIQAYGKCWWSYIRCISELICLNEYWNNSEIRQIGNRMKLLNEWIFMHSVFRELSIQQVALTFSIPLTLFTHKRFLRKNFYERYVTESRTSSKCALSIIMSLNEIVGLSLNSIVYACLYPPIVALH